MKVTANLDDKTIEEAMKFSNSSTITDALKIALNAYVTIHKLRELSKNVKNNPLEFSYASQNIRKVNRNL